MEKLSKFLILTALLFLAIIELYLILKLFGFNAEKKFSLIYLTYSIINLLIFFIILFLFLNKRLSNFLLIYYLSIIFITLYIFEVFSAYRLNPILVNSFLIC